MKRSETVYRELLFQGIENKKFKFTQLELSKRLNLSLSVINSAIKKLSSIGAINVNQRSFEVIDIKKILYFWASLRNLEKDLIFSIRIDAPIRDIEKVMPNILFTSYTAYKLKFNDVPSDYSEVYLYATEEELKSIKERIKDFKKTDKNPNLFILIKDPSLAHYKSIPLAQIFVDLWNLKEWYAKEF